MTVDNLLEEYNKSVKVKKPYNFKQHITKQYMPYRDKLVLSKGVVDGSSYITVGDKQIYKRDTPNMLFIFTMKLIESYTDLEITAENVLADYDKLMESNVMNQLMTEISESEISILRGMVDMMRDDLECNTRSLVSFLETKTDALQLVMDNLTKTLEDPNLRDKIAEFTKK